MLNFKLKEFSRVSRGFREYGAGAFCIRKTEDKGRVFILALPVKDSCSDSLFLTNIPIYCAEDGDEIDCNSWYWNEQKRTLSPSIRCSGAVTFHGVVVQGILTEL